MVSSNKILTVSYGTFSCTLEGFDESFDTMKAIAEYFRDLAADDRYFGAEPPTPDAEMLARIAEREISRRVQASEEQGKIVLRADEAGAQVSAQPTTATETQDIRANTAEVTVAPGQYSAPQLAAFLADTKPDVVTDVAERPAPAKDATADETPSVADMPDAPDAAEDTTVAEPASAADMPDSPQDHADTAPLAKADTPVAENLPEADHTESPELAADPVGLHYDAEAELAAQDAPMPEDALSTEDSVAAKLRRIRSVVVQKDLDYEISEYSEDEHAQDVLSDASAELDALLATAREEDEAEAAEQKTMVSEAAPDEALDLDAFMANADDGMTDDLSRALEGESAAAQDTPAKDDAKLLNEDTLAQLLADAMPEETLEQDDAEDVLVPETRAEPEPEPTPESARCALVLDGDSRIADPEDAVSETEKAPIRARVMKMKRSDFEAALQSGVLEEDDPTPDAGTEPDIGATSEYGDDLTPEEEAELQRELAAVEAELGLGPADEDVAPSGQNPEIAPDADKAPAPDMVDETLADTEPQEAPADKPRRGLAKLISGVRRQPEDVERIFDEADSQLGDQENSLRRNAIQHLRAAVAATRAEKSAGGRLDEGVDETPYRSDLAQVVRPRRPSVDSAGTPNATERPSEQRPAPLKLVAEQRVDRERSPVRPRRVVASPETAPQAAGSGSEGGFPAFAANLGASDLPDLLEAAAAYMSDVEGHPEFSRPMLMSKLKEAVPGDFTREDGLRSFGQLLRNGKLRKIKAGRFAVTDHTEFREEARNAG
jgi:hypothetical protein